MFKKLLFATVFSIAAFTGASAGEYVVYQNGRLGANLDDANWWNASYNFVATSPDDEGTKVFEFKANDGSAASMGLNMIAPGNTGSLHSATLSFKYYAKGTGDYTIRLTGKTQYESEEYKFTVTENETGKWNEVSYVVAEQQPSVAKEWKEDANRGVGYVFSIILDNGTDESVIYLQDIIYTGTDDSWVAPDHGQTAPETVPMPEKSAEEILSFLTPYGKINYSFPWWGQATQPSNTSIDDKDVLHLTNFNYQGLDGFDFDISGYTHMHVDYWTHDGTTFSFCPISLDPTTVDAPRWYAPEVKQREWNSYDAPIAEFNSALNLNSIKQLKFDDGGNCEAYIANIYFWKDENAGGEEPEQPEEPEVGGSYTATLTGKYTGAENEPEFTLTYTATLNEDGKVTFNVNITPLVTGLSPQLFTNGEYEANLVDQGNGNYTYTTKDAHQAGTEPFNFYLAYAGGAVNIASGYVVGSTNSSTGGEEPEQPEEPGEGIVYKGTVESSDTYKDVEYPYVVTYEVTYNSNKTLTVSGSLEWLEDQMPGATNLMAYFPDGNFEGNLSAGPYTTEKTYELGQEVRINFWVARAEGRTECYTIYVVGSTNDSENQDKVELTAKAENVTADSAEISYEVTVPDGYVVTVNYRTEVGEAVTATESPIKLIDLNENTEYTYILSATAVKDDVTITSKDVKVSFKTLREGARAYVYEDLYKAEFKDAYLVGEDESMRRSFFVTLPWSVVYDADDNATYSIDLSEVPAIVGMVPQIWADGFFNLTQREGTDIWEYQFGHKDFESTAAISHYITYASTSKIDSRTPYTQWGMEKERPEMGDATGLRLTASKSYALIGERIILTGVPTDENGYYLPADDIDYTVENGPFELTGDFLTLVEFKGTRTVTATMGELTAKVEVTAMASSEATDVIAGNTEGVTDEENIMENTKVDAVTDNNPSTELRWDCKTTQEHYLIYDLGEEGKYIEAIDLLFEGAYATKFTITLSNTAPAELNAGATDGLSTLAAATEDVVFEPAKNDTQHYFLQDPTGSHRYVTFRSTEALNSGWGIKIKDMKVYGTDAVPSTTGVDEIATTDDNAPVEYYNLQGVRVANPTNGLYIRRQGNTATKVLVK